MIEARRPGCVPSNYSGTKPSHRNNPSVSSSSQLATFFLLQASAPLCEESGFEIDLESEGLQQVWRNILVVLVS
jgi:hypothetical protein